MHPQYRDGNAHEQSSLLKEDSNLRPPAPKAWGQFINLGFN